MSLTRTHGQTQRTDVCCVDVYKPQEPQAAGWVSCCASVNYFLRTHICYTFNTSNNLPPDFTHTSLQSHNTSITVSHKS